MWRVRSRGKPLASCASSCDPSGYTVTLPPGEMGLVLELDDDTAQAVVCEVLAGGPLHGKVTVGDVLTHVDRQSVVELTLSQIVRLCRRAKRSSKSVSFLYGLRSHSAG